METRRSARIPARFWVGVEGVDDQLKQRHGDISATGIYVEVQKPLGDIGTVQWLHLASIDRQHRLEVMAHVVRVISFADLKRGSVTGVALEFMPESDDNAQAVQEFVRHVLALRLEEDLALEVSHELVASVENDSAEKLSATVRQLSVHGLLLDTNWSMKVGDTVGIEIHAPAARHPIKIRGQAISVVAGGAGFRIELQVRGDSLSPGPVSGPSPMSANAERPMRASMRPGAIESLFADLITPAPSTAAPMRKEHLAGQLSRVRMPTLLSLFEMERMTGELAIVRGEEKTRLFVRDGRVVDVEDDGAVAIPRERVAALLSSNEGTFDFSMSPVERPDRIGVSTTTLILDMARSHDESSRDLMKEAGEA